MNKLSQSVMAERDILTPVDLGEKVLSKNEVR